MVQEGGVHHGVIRVHPEGIPEGGEQSVIEARPRTAAPSPNSVGHPVDRVKKFWGEFF